MYTQARGNPCDIVGPVKSAAETARELYLQTLNKARAAARFALGARDREAVAMATSEDLHLPLDGRRLTARLYRPVAAPKTETLLIYFHGGGFVLGDIETHDALCRRLSASGATTVLSVAYRLAPEHAFPAQLDDAVDTASLVMAQAQAWGIDPDRIAIGGDSAGAYLALAACLKSPGQFATLLLIYPLLQLDEEVWADSVFKDGRVIGRLAVRYIRTQLQDAQAGAPSLLNCATVNLPPVVIVSGGALDPVRPDAVAFAERLTREGAWVEFREYQRQPHGFLNLTHLSPLARQATAETGQLLAERLRR